MNRREFLHAAIAAPVVSPILLNVQDKAGTKLPSKSALMRLAVVPATGSSPGPSGVKR